METNVIEIAPVGYLLFGPGPGSEEPDEPEQDEESNADTPKREKAPERDGKPVHPQPAHPHRREDGEHSR